MAYTCKEEIRPQPGKQTQLMKMIQNQDVDFCLIGGSRFGGKVMPYSEPVQTPWGEKTHGDMKVGSVILNPDGSRQNVLSVHPHKDWDFYKINFTDGSSCEAGLEHKWIAWRSDHKTKSTLRSEKEGRTCDKYSLFPDDAEVTNTEGLIDWLKRGYTPRIPVTQPVRYEKSLHPDTPMIDPYLLGYLISDGSLAEEKNLRITRHEDDNQIDGILSDLGYLMSCPPSDPQSLKFLVGAAKDALVKFLQSTNLLGTHSHDKFIPVRYKTTSVDSRQELLKGLMDSDGYVSVDGKYYYTTTSEQLAGDVKSLVESLGGLATITSKTGVSVKEGIRVECRVAYTMYIILPDGFKPFRLQRKLDRCILIKDKRLHRTISSIEFSRKCDGCCIEVSNPNRLYLAGDFIVTHNTELLSMMPLLYANDPYFRGIFFRRSYEEIMGANGLWQKAQNQYKFFDAKSNKTDKTWEFPEGAIVQYSHMYNEGDEDSHRGKGYSMVGFDEINQFTEEQVQMLATCLRSEADMDSFMVGTLNPDPDSWCMKLVDYYLDQDTGYPDPKKCGEVRWYIIKDDQFIFGPSEEWFQEHHMDALNVLMPNGKVRYTRPKRFTFIFFTIFDNEIGMDLNPGYISELNNLPDHKRETQLYGNWFAREKSENMFDSTWLKETTSTPAHSDCCRAWDKAYSEDIKKKPDFSASIKMWKTPDGRYIITGDYDTTIHDTFKPGEDVIYGKFRKLAGQRNLWMLKQADYDGPDCTIVHPEETGAGKGECQELTKMFTENGYRSATVKTGNVAGAKKQKFVNFTSAAQNGLVYVIPSTFGNVATYKAFTKELESFTGERSTANRKDDWVDCVSDCFLHLCKKKVYKPWVVPDISAPTRLSDFRNHR